MSLPSGYKRLEYIQSSGTQQIDTGFKPNNNTKITADAEYISSDGTYPALFGARNGGSQQFWLFWGGSAFISRYNTSDITVAATLTDRHQFTLNKNVLSIDGSSATGATATFQSNYNAYLFSVNASGSTSYCCKARLYSCQIYDNGTLIRDYIPCQTTAGEIGLWDDVNSVFYGNAGTGTFTAGPAIAIATDESEITELEYIQSSGVEAINTGRIIYSENMRVTMRFAYTADHGASSLFGSEASGVSGSGEYSMVPWGTPQFYVGGSKSLTSAYTPQLNEVCTLDITADDGILTDVWNESTSNSQSYTQKLNHTYSIAIFGNNISGTISQKSSIKLYSFQLYDNGELARDYIAAKLSDGTVGLYDKLHGLLYINVGSGTFAAGPEVPKAPSTPSGFAAVRLTDTTVQLYWTASDGAAGYKLYKNGALLATLTDTSYTDTVQVFSSAVYAVTAYNDDGESEATTLTYYAAPENPILYLVTDRTDADVNAGNDKGTYKASDLNRVGAAMNYVADRLKAQGYDPHISPKTDWKDDDWVDPAAQVVYLGDLAELRKQFALYETTPEVPPRILATAINSNDGLTYTWANDIEQILMDIDVLLTNIAAGWLYSGELYAGEV